MAELLVAMVIVTVIGTMLVASWISLQRSFAFAQAKNTARATARDALARMSSELRAAQPPTEPTSGDPSSMTPFYLLLAAPYVCGETSCVFYSAYNNSAAADGTGRAQLRLTAIWLDTSGTKAQKTLKWTRDTNKSGLLGDTVGGIADTTRILAENVVNTAFVNKPIFTYWRPDATVVWVSSTKLTSSNVEKIRAVRIELLVDADLSHSPSTIDLTTTVRPRNAGTF
jgi:type II secretory pathway pseudopilin PulG